MGVFTLKNISKNISELDMLLRVELQDENFFVMDGQWGCKTKNIFARGFRRLGWVGGGLSTPAKIPIVLLRLRARHFAGVRFFRVCFFCLVLPGNLFFYCYSEETVAVRHIPNRCEFRLRHEQRRLRVRRSRRRATDFPRFPRRTVRFPAEETKGAKHARESVIPWVVVAACPYLNHVDQCNHALSVHV